MGKYLPNRGAPKIIPNFSKGFLSNNVELTGRMYLIIIASLI
jgi:hypothetical protein